MINFKIAIVFIGLNFIGCTSIVDMDIPLTKQFKDNSSLISIATPHLRALDSVYNKKLGDYNVINSKTTWKSLDSTVVGHNYEVNFLDYLLFNNSIFSKVKKFKVEGSQRFSFDLAKENIKKISSKCEIFSQSNHEERTTIHNIDDTISVGKNNSFHTRAKTFLLCTIDNGSETGTLSLESYSTKPLEVKLKFNNSSYKIEEVSQRYDILSTGEKRTSAPWLSLSSGINIYNKSEQVSSVALLNKIKIRLNKHLSIKEKEFLLSANYCLTMFYWLDGEKWRRTKK